MVSHRAACRRVRSLQLVDVEAPGAVQALHVSIPLKPQPTPAPLPPRLAQAVKDEFAIRYLQKIGASSSPENIALVLQNLPLDKCTVSAAWKSRGSLSDVLAIDLNPKALVQTGDEVPPMAVGRAGSKFNVLKPDTDVAAVPSPQAPQIRQFRGHHARREFRIGIVSLTFDEMKRKFLLPFKLAKPPAEVDILQTYGTAPDTGASSEGASSNQTQDSVAKPSSPGSLRRWESQKRVKCAHERSVPPSASAATVRELHEEYYLALPLASLGLLESDGHMRTVLYTALVSPRMVELVQSTMQYLYLSVVIPVDKEEHNNSVLEALFVSLTQSFAALRAKMEHHQRPSPQYRLAVLVPLLLLALRVDVETLTRLQYPFNFASATNDMTRLLQALDDKVSQVLDPDANWSRLAVLETTHEAGQARSSSSFQRARRHRRLRDQFYQTSAALHEVFPDPSSGKCRRLITLRGGAGINQYPDFAADDTKRDERRYPVSVASKLSLLQSLRRSQG